MVGGEFCEHQDGCRRPARGGDTNGSIDGDDLQGRPRGRSGWPILGSAGPPELQSHSGSQQSSVVFIEQRQRERQRILLHRGQQSQRGQTSSRRTCSAPCEGTRRSASRFGGTSPPAKMAATFNLETPRAGFTNRFGVDFQEVAHHQLCDLEKIEHAFSQDATFTRDALMTIDPRRDRSTMKNIAMRAVNRRLRVYTDGNCFILREPRHQLNRQQTCQLAAQRQGTASTTPKASVAKIVAVALTPGPGPAAKP